MTFSWQEYETQLKKFEKQRSIWVFLSIVFFFFLLTLYFTREDIIMLNERVLHTTFYFSATLCSAWWMWTMYIIKRLINYKKVEIKILYETVLEIRTIKKEISKLK